MRSKNSKAKMIFDLWRLKIRTLLVHQGLEEALQGETALDAKLEERDKKILTDKAHNAIILSLGDKVLR